MVTNPIALQGLGARCDGRSLARGVTAAEARLILAVHNRLRQRLAGGRERRGRPGPQAAAVTLTTLGPQAHQPDYFE